MTIIQKLSVFWVDQVQVKAPNASTWKNNSGLDIYLQVICWESNRKMMGCTLSF